MMSGIDPILVRWTMVHLRIDRGSAIIDAHIVAGLLDQHNFLFCTTMKTQLPLIWHRRNSSMIYVLSGLIRFVT